MVYLFTQLIIGFSVISGAILLFAYLFFLQEMQKTTLALAACTALLITLTGLQLEHLRFLQTGFDLLNSRTYVVLLLAAPPAFYFFSKELLLPGSNRSFLQVVHLLPLPYIDASIFYIAYANFTGVAMILIVAALIIFPELLSDISNAARLTYSISTLNDVDIGGKLKQLEKLMSEDKLFQNENLNLTLLAEAVQLSSHQLSELINSQFGFGFPRYIREQRVREAIRLLAEETSSSVLTISLATGFRSQSNFYTAFREITGEAPGSFRKQHRSD